MTNASDRVIAFDFDGVLAQYSGFISARDIQPPNPAVLDTIKILKERGNKILIHSTRGDEFLREYCTQFSIPVDYINRRPDREGENPGKPIASVYVDDHALCYKGQSSEELVAEIENFKTYWRK